MLIYSISFFLFSFVYVWLNYHVDSLLSQIQSNSYKKASRRIEALESLFEKHEIAKSPLIKQKLKVLQRKQELTARIKSIKKTIRSSTVLAFKDELKARKRVLRRLGYWKFWSALFFIPSFHFFPFFAEWSWSFDIALKFCSKLLYTIILYCLMLKVIKRFLEILSQFCSQMQHKCIYFFYFCYLCGLLSTFV